MKRSLYHKIGKGKHRFKRRRIEGERQRTCNGGSGGK